MKCVQWVVSKSNREDDRHLSLSWVLDKVETPLLKLQIKNEM